MLHPARATPRARCPSSEQQGVGSRFINGTFPVISKVTIHLWWCDFKTLVPTRRRSADIEPGDSVREYTDRRIAIRNAHLSGIPGNSGNRSDVRVGATVPPLWTDPLWPPWGLAAPVSGRGHHRGVWMLPLLCPSPGREMWRRLQLPGQVWSGSLLSDSGPGEVHGPPARGKLCQR